MIIYKKQSMYTIKYKIELKYDWYIYFLEKKEVEIQIFLYIYYKGKVEKSELFFLKKWKY